MKSPKEFAKGLGKGTKSLLSGLVTGTVTSTMSIVETATLGASSTASFLSGDTEASKYRILYTFSLLICIGEEVKVGRRKVPKA